MKVILIKDVARIGRRGEVKEVPSGHALNFLIPRKLAEPATPENLKRQAERASRVAHDAQSTDESFTAALKNLAEVPVELRADANEQGHLFKGVKAGDVSARLKEVGYDIPEDCIELPHPLKSLGTHAVTLKRGERTGTLTLLIIQK